VTAAAAMPHRDDGARQARRRPVQTKDFVQHLTKILIGVVVVGVLFGIAWSKGYMLRLSGYWQETMVELKKCNWPTWEELKGSTVLVAISIALLGGFTVAADFVFAHLIFWISKI
jgi:preprotein translocase subunit SecE